MTEQVLLTNRDLAETPGANHTALQERGGPSVSRVTHATLSETALAYAQQSLSAATRRAYGSQLRAWEAWCLKGGNQAMPASPALLANHLAELAGTRSFATIELRLAAIVSAHCLLRQPFDAADPDLRRTLSGIARTHGTKPKRQSVPLLTGDVIKIASACGGGRCAERDRALILLGFAGAFRRSELCAIDIAHLKFVREGLAVYLSSSKSDQEHAGETVAVAANPLSAHCPVAAVRRWIEGAEITVGPLFRRVTRDGALGLRPLSAEAVRIILQRRVEDAGFRGEALARITPHSLRSGCITTLARASVHERDIMKHSRHGSATVMRGYIRSSLAPEAFTSGALWGRLFDEDR